MCRNFGAPPGCAAPLAHGMAPMRLEGEELACVRGGREVFRGLAFTISGGEALLVTGRNGAGKSSLLRMIAGLVRVAGGRLTMTGADPERSIPEQAHYLGHQDALKTSLSVAENLRFWTRYLGGGGPVQAALADGGAGCPGRSASGLPVGRAAAAAVHRPAGGGEQADLAARRADFGARRSSPAVLGQAHGRTSGARRHDPGGDAWAGRAGKSRELRLGAAP